MTCSNRNDLLDHLVSDGEQGVMVAECHQTAVGSSPDSGTWAQQTRRELETSWVNETVLLAASPASPSPKDFRACREPDTGQRVQSSGEEGAMWLELAAVTVAMAIGFSVLALEVEL